MANIVFTDPPPNSGGRQTAHPWAEIAATLRENPGRWALCIRGLHSSYVSQIRRGTLSAFAPAGAFDARGVKSTLPPENGKNHGVDLYIKYNGEPEAPVESD